jgi:hypothetical protein
MRAERDARAGAGGETPVARAPPAAPARAPRAAVVLASLVTFGAGWAMRGALARPGAAPEWGWPGAGIPLVGGQAGQDAELGEQRLARLAPRGVGVTGAALARCGATARRGWHERPSAGYVLGLSSRLKYEAEVEEERSPQHRNVHAGFGDQMARHVELLACAARLDLRVVCVPEMFRTDPLHHTGNLGFMFGCFSKYFACGHFTSWGELGLALTVAESVTAAEAQALLSARGAGGGSSDSSGGSGAGAIFGTRLNAPAPDGKVVFRSVECKAADKEETRAARSQGYRFLRDQWQDMYIAMARTTPLWSEPADRRWRIGVTVRRGDSNRGQGVRDECRLLDDLFRASGSRLNASSAEVLVFSEVAEDDPEFDCLRGRPGVRLLLGNKTLWQHAAVARWVRDVDHLASAHFVRGGYSTFANLVAALAAEEHLSLAAPHLNETQLVAFLDRHPAPFKTADPVRRRAASPLR